MRTLIKICGLTRPEDCLWANELKPDFIGFVFAESRRWVSPREAGMIASGLDRSIKKVGVFVEPWIDEIEEVLAVCPLDIIQLHGDKTDSIIKKLGIPIWKALRVKTPVELDKVGSYNADAVLLDSWSDKAHGGTNTTFPWEWAQGLKPNLPVVLAGGLNAQNVQKAINIVKPYAVDVSSSVESKGFKDAKKVEAFIRKVREL